jgi:hypothetical protein
VQGALSRARLTTGAVIPIFLVLVVGTLALVFSSSYDTWGALLVAPVLILVSLPVLTRQARREGDPSVFYLLVLALLLKLAGALVRHFVAFDIYGGVADAADYDQWGTRLAEQFHAGIFHTGLDSLAGTDFIRFLTGLIYTITGPTQLGGFLVYSWLGFWGLFLFYRAFTVAVPEGRRRSYAYLVFFLPSLLFWPSSIGKEAWMTFSLGLAAYGSARMLADRTVRGLVVAGIGLWLTALVRPHVAGILGLALLAGYVVRRPRIELGLVAPLAKGAAVLVLAVLAGFLVARTDRFLTESNIGSGGSVFSVLADVSERTGQGGSKFAPSIIESPARAPVAIGTVLFRPLVFEAHNDQTLAAALEGTFLLVLSLLRVPWMVAALRSIRRQPYVAMAIVYTVLFIVAFSAVANFGLLARERVQLLPLYLVLLCVSPPRKEEHAPIAAEAQPRGLHAPIR